MGSRQRYRTLTDLTAVIAAHHDPRLDMAVRDLQAASPRFLEACQRLQDARPSTLGAASYDGPGGSSSDTSDPTGRLALTPDTTAHDRMALDSALHTLHKFRYHAHIYHRNIAASALVVRRVVEAWAPRHPTDKDRRAVEHANDRGLCDHHRTIGIAEPTAKTGTVANNLTLPMALCQPCYDHVRYHGKLPTGEWMERRARTGKTEPLHTC